MYCWWMMENREGFNRKGYKWEENGFKIVGEAASGKEALEYINYHEGGYCGD